MNDFQPPVLFRLSAGFSGKDMAFEIGFFPNFSGGGLSIQQILDVSNMSTILDVSKSFPSVSDFSNAFHISNASLGWGKKGISFMKLGIDIAEWNVIDGKFKITDLSFDIYSTFPKESKQFSIWGSGAIRIADFDLGVLFDINLNHVSFQLLTIDTPLTLKSIFGHFLGDNDTVLPQAFISVLEETGIESVIVEGSHDTGSWSLSRFALVASISARLDISGVFSMRISSPKVINFASYRKIQAIIPQARRRRCISLHEGGLFPVFFKKIPCDVE